MIQKLIERLLEDVEDMFEPASQEEIESRLDKAIDDVRSDLEDYYRSNTGEAKDDFDRYTGLSLDGFLQDEITTEIQNYGLEDLLQVYEDYIGKPPDREEDEDKYEYQDRIEREITDEVELTTGDELDNWFSEITKMDVDECVIDELMSQMDDEVVKERYLELLDSDVI
jgi:hypothetical protein